MIADALKFYSDLCNFAGTNKKESLELASLAYHLLSKTDPPTLSQAAITASKTLDLLKDSEPPEFKTQPSLIFFYLLYFVDIESKGFEDERDWVLFLVSLNSQRYNSLNQKVGGGYHRIICLIANRIYAVNIAGLVAENKLSSRILRHVFWDILPFVTGEAELLVSAIWQATTGIKEEQNYISLRQSIRQTAETTPEFARLLMEKCHSLPERQRLFVPPVFLGTVSAIGIGDALLPIIELLKSANAEEQQIGIHCLSLLHGDKDNPQDFSPLFLSDLLALEKKNDDTVITQLISMWGLLIDKLPDARSKLKELPLLYPGKKCYGALSYIMFLKAEEEIEAEWYKSGLKILSNLSDQYPATYDNIAQALIRILPAHNLLVKDYIDDFIATPANKIDNLQGFEELFTELQEQNPGLLSVWITNWFNGDNQRSPAAAAKILDLVSRSSASSIVLDYATLKSLPENDVEYILYKIVGYVYDKEQMQTLVLSALVEENQYDLVERLVIELFSFYIIYNYHSALDFIKGKKESAGKLQQRVIMAIEEHFDQLYNINNNIPKELFPSPARLQTLFDQKNKVLMDINTRSPFQRPSFLDEITKVTVKIGKRILARDSLEMLRKKDWAKHGGELQSIAHSIEIPSGEFIDPVGQEYNRYLWKTFKRRK